jgi:hypothetical protein
MNIQKQMSLTNLRKAHVKIEEQGEHAFKLYYSWYIVFCLQVIKTCNQQPIKDMVVKTEPD